MGEYYIGIDLGGTNIAVGIVNENGKMICKDSCPTRKERSADDIVEDMARLINGMLIHMNMKINNVNSIGLGVPGTANHETGMIEDANNLIFCENVSIIQLLQTYFPNQKILFDNDANAAAWGEYLAGAGQGYRSVVAVTLGTGVGGGIIIDGKIYEGVNYAAGEFGHFVINFEGKSCNCGRKGCFEAYASATALIEQTKEVMAHYPDSLLWKISGGQVEGVTGKKLFEAIEQEDATAKQIFNKYIEYLVIGIINIINIFQPEVICIGGGIGEAGDVLIKPLEQMVKNKNYASFSKNQTKIVKAELGNDAGIIGAALLGIEKKQSWK